ncbi:MULTISPECIES: YiaA/YiaB family inner membrane protein [Nocardiopsidaceae]|jgi:hypothetical protein|uniref:YiaA/YiaB family inner membrane protein n=2 Tax=Nocardiopsidaceae TaxID=83676 RepID=A0ABY6YVD0_9ACTN|nr:YiaA/YiaB family inner membrane protein [Streptomonospora nanhaiensis]WAE76306.1 YiaA/YiaB family inner membrane protein [Streptomonospora nanhaiensis]
MNTFTPRSSPHFYLQSAISFGISSVGVGAGIVYLPVDLWIRAFLGLGLLYVVTSTFTLAKCVRDRQEDAVAAELAQSYQQAPLWNGTEQPVQR